MLRNAICWIAAAALLLTSAPAFAWSAQGHRLIADAAYARLNVRARTEVDRLIATDASDPVEGCAMNTFADVATWSDCVRGISSFRNQSPWHYDNIPICGEPPPRDVYCAHGDCATAAIERGVRMLGNRRATNQQRLRALARVVHFIGDIHQPLHASDNGDRGGNDVRVTFLGAATYATREGASRPNNLHGVWDGPLLTAAVGADDAAARIQIEALARAHEGAWRTGDAQAWALESHDVAVRFIYTRWPEPLTCGASPGAPVVVDQAYVDAAAPIIRQQVARAAVRLAARLNAVWP